MGRQIIVRTPYPTSEEIMDSMGMSKARRKKIAKIVSLVSFSRNEETGEIEYKIADTPKRSRKLKDAA